MPDQTSRPLLGAPNHPRVTHDSHSLQTQNCSCFCVDCSFLQPIDALVDITMMVNPRRTAG